MPCLAAPDEVKEAAPPAPNAPPWAARAVWALAIFLAINLAFSLSTVRSGRPAEGGAQFVACDTAVGEYAKMRGRPLVLMGSSLVMAPVWSADAAHFQGVNNVYLHHRSRRLEEHLAGLGVRQNAFSFGLPGAMVSDIYLIAEKLFKDELTPRLVVFGIAPRDLMDDLLTGETRTAVFKRLMEMDDLSRLGDMYLSSWQEKADFVANNAVFLYGKRWRYQDKLAGATRSLYDRVMPAAASPPAASAEQQFLAGTDRAEVWRKSIDEYRGRYRHFNASQFAKQKSFLEKFLATSRERGYPLLIVNMPLTSANLALMPPGFYSRYMEALRALCRRYHVDLADMQQDPSLTDADFYDTVHLNAAGGDKFLKSVALRAQALLARRDAGKL